MPLQDDIHQLADQYLDEIIQYRRHIHQHPELSFEEYQTSAFVAQKLEEWGVPYESGIAKTGIIAILKGSNPNSKIVAGRADMDALPIQEANEVAYKSQKEGKMHACGHDVHTSSMLGAVKILHELSDRWDGTIKVLFQPSEEKLPGGASYMIEEGALQNPEPASIFGQHVYPELEAGKVGFRAGTYMASADELYLTVRGRGGHAALPHLNVDPVLITSHIITSLQQVVSRNANPLTPSVLSFGKIHGNGATNVIPDEVELVGTFRTLDEEWRQEAHERIRSIARDTAKSMGGACDVNIVKGYPCVVNEPALTSRAQSAAKDYMGEENVIDLPIRMTAEDFAYYSQVMPGCFYRLGVGNEEKGITSGLHTPTFDIDEKALATGMGLMAWLLVSELQV